MLRKRSLEEILVWLHPWPTDESREALCSDALGFSETLLQRGRVTNSLFSDALNTSVFTRSLTQIIHLAFHYLEALHIFPSLIPPPCTRAMQLQAPTMQGVTSSTSREVLPPGDRRTHHAPFPATHVQHSWQFFLLYLYFTYSFYVYPQLLHIPFKSSLPAGFITNTDMHWLLPLTDYRKKLASSAEP